MLKWIGGMLIVASCGGCGFLMAARYRAEEEAIRQLIRALDYMQCELQYRLTPLPQLCRQAGQEVKGCPQAVLTAMADELERQIAPDAASCMSAALEGREIPSGLRIGFDMLGASLGRFDLEGQLQGLRSVRSHCRAQLSELSGSRDQRVRSYQTLGLCAGAALAILLV